MKRFVRSFLILLSSMPVATIAFAANAKASEIDGEAQNELLLKTLFDVRAKVLKPDQAFVTLDDAKARYAGLSGLQGTALDRSFEKDVSDLANQGLIELNENFIVSAGPSQI